MIKYGKTKFPLKSTSDKVKKIKKKFLQLLSAPTSKEDSNPLYVTLSNSNKAMVLVDAFISTKVIKRGADVTLFRKAIKSDYMDHLSLVDLSSSLLDDFIRKTLLGLPDYMNNVAYDELPLGFSEYQVFFVKDIYPVRHYSKEMNIWYSNYMITFKGFSYPSSNQLIHREFSQEKVKEILSKMNLNKTFEDDYGYDIDRHGNCVCPDLGGMFIGFYTDVQDDGVIHLKDPHFTGKIKEFNNRLMLIRLRDKCILNKYTECIYCEVGRDKCILSRHSTDFKTGACANQWDETHYGYIVPGSGGYCLMCNSFKNE